MRFDPPATRNTISCRPNGSIDDTAAAATAAAVPIKVNFLVIEKLSRKIAW
jgi:hypothetical protein